MYLASLLALHRFKEKLRVPLFYASIAGSNPSIRAELGRQLRNEAKRLPQNEAIGLKRAA
jgi:hypothetical protein